MNRERKSLVTGMRTVDGGSVFGSRGVMVHLYDGARALPVWAKWSEQARVRMTLRGGKGFARLDAEVFVCCGPPAPNPLPDVEDIMDHWERMRYAERS